MGRVVYRGSSPINTTQCNVQFIWQTTNYLVKETISGRKNVSPQNIYEVNQLYNAGALKVACVGLQCVGFNRDVYKAILEHAAKFTQAKWKTMNVAAVPLTNMSNAATVNAGTGTSGSSKLSNVSAKLSIDISRPVSPILLGSTNTGFGVVTAGLGLGNGTTWNTASLLTQGNNQGIFSSNGNENLQPAEGMVMGHRAGVKK